MTQTGTRMREDIELLIDRIYLRGNWLHTDTAHFKAFSCSSRRVGGREDTGGTPVTTGRLALPSAVVAAVSAAEKIPAARRLLQGA